MDRLKADFDFFKAINFEDTLNYKHNPELEKSIADVIDYLQIDMNTLSRRKMKLTKEQRMAYFLKIGLLYVTSDPACIKVMEESSVAISSNYILVILKKYYYKIECNLEELLV